MVDRQRMLREIGRRNASDAESFMRPPQASNFAHYPTWNAMMQDAVVNSAVYSIIESILYRPWKLEGDARIVAWLEDQLHRIDLLKVLENSLSALWRGFSVSEIVWQYRNKFFELEGLYDLDTDNLAFLCDNRTLRINAIVNEPQGSQRQILPLEKVFLFRHKPDRQHPAGRSILDTAYRSYMAKDRILKLWGTSLQRFGLPYVIAQVPTNYPTEATEALIDALYGMQADGISIIPDNVAYQVHTPSYAQTLTMAEAVQYHDTQIRAAILLSYVGGSVLKHDDISSSEAINLENLQIVRQELIAQSLAHEFTKQVIDPLIKCNFGRGSVRLVFDRHRTREKVSDLKEDV